MKLQVAPGLTRISSKGRIVIPFHVRKRLGIEAGTMFAVLTPRKDVVVLRKVDSKASQVDLRTLREAERAWREIEQGQERRTTKGRFLEGLETW
ncbi:AbrB/MazE/SpoVT family DNA-binding domain-containing protein [Candidatus Bathyarchaeota archaeon]|jgi:AbrB family looped-hinge helix DNA binding protein|nr:AbrB/MazE/SpoVT family DNA-binding domain-containing protein [Candidatus Bathyarchaeota archaeon]